METSIVEKHIRPAFGWFLVTIKEIRRLKVLQSMVAVFAVGLVLAGGLKGDGTELGWARVVLKVFESAIIFTMLVAGAILSAYLIPYEEMHRNRILLTGTWPLSREGMLVGTAAGVITASVLTTALMYVLLGGRLWISTSPGTRAHLAGRVRLAVDSVRGPGGKPVEDVVKPDGTREEGVAAIEGGREARVVLERPEGKAFVSFALYAGGRHSIRARVYFEGRVPPDEPELFPLNTVHEIPVPDAPAGTKMVMVVENGTPGSRVSLPVAETDLLVQKAGLWGNLGLAFLARVLAVGYTVLVGVGLSGFMGFAGSLAVVMALIIGAYLAPFVTGLFDLPRFASGQVDVEKSWNVVLAAGNLFGDLLHVSPAERLPLGFLVPVECLKLGGLMVVRGVIFLGIGAFLFSRREVGS